MGYNEDKFNSAWERCHAVLVLASILHQATCSNIKLS